MIVFQNKIIYMPSVPPFSRSEKIDDYKYPASVAWREEHIRSTDNTRLALAIGTSSVYNQASAPKNTTVIAYFQGNASSLPPRLPGLSNILCDLQHQSGDSHQYIIVALSYRGFWTSRGRPSQRGIEKDSQAFLSWLQTFPDSKRKDVQLIIWGQSIGAAVAASATASWLGGYRDESSNQSPQIHGLILETPFTTMKDMLIAMYPQKWLPYRYLWPFLRNTWDNGAALNAIAQQPDSLKPKVLIIRAGKDELIPPEHSLLLLLRCNELGLPAQRVIIPGAYHTTAAQSAKGRDEITTFVGNQISSSHPG